jgi:Dissimilatory sulfite reductase (desulfoviridin), alpha and beta subunits
MAIGWYPIVDKEICSTCGICYDFCPHDVYEWNEGPIVIRPENCINRCHGCEKQCPSQAIRYFGDESFKLIKL